MGRNVIALREHPIYLDYRPKLGLFEPKDVIVRDIFELTNEQRRFLMDNDHAKEVLKVLRRRNYAYSGMYLHRQISVCLGKDYDILEANSALIGVVAFRFASLFGTSDFENPFIWRLKIRPLYNTKSSSNEEMREILYSRSSCIEDFVS